MKHLSILKNKSIEISLVVASEYEFFLKNLYNFILNFFLILDN